MTADGDARESIVRAGESLFARGLTHGRTGNISVRLGQTFLITPSGRSLGQLEPSDLSIVGMDGRHLDGPIPSKEAFLHLAMYQARAEDTAVVHLHSTYSVAVSCLTHADPSDVLPPLTAYYIMRVGKLPLLPYHAPGDRTLAPIAKAAAVEHHAMLLANHGPIVSAPGLAAATDSIEELEQTARLFLLVTGREVRSLSTAEVDELRT